MSYNTLIFSTNIVEKQAGVLSVSKFPLGYIRPLFFGTVFSASFGGSVDIGSSYACRYRFKAFFCYLRANPYENTIVPWFAIMVNNNSLSSTFCHLICINGMQSSTLTTLTLPGENMIQVSKYLDHLRNKEFIFVAAKL